MFRRSQKTLIYVLLLLIPFMLYFVRSDSFSSLKFRVIQLTAAPIRVLSFPFKEFKKILYYHRVFDEYQRLNKEVQVLKSRLTMMDEVLYENARLEDLLDFKRKLVYSSVAANVVGRDPSFWNSSMVLDKGREHGVAVGMPVVNASGVVGKIAEVGERQSKVILLTDPQFSLAALIQRPREAGLVSGSLQGVCRLRFIKKDTDVKIGDKVVTSKLSSSFPEGLVIGDVVSINEAQGESGPMVTLQPAVVLSRLEEVLIILNAPDTYGAVEE